MQPLMKGVAPGRGRCSWKVLIGGTVLIGLGFAALIGGGLRGRCAGPSGQVQVQEQNIDLDKSVVQNLAEKAAEAAALDDESVVQNPDMQDEAAAEERVDLEAELGIGWCLWHVFGEGEECESGAEAGGRHKAPAALRRRARLQHDWGDEWQEGTHGDLDRAAEVDVAARYCLELATLDLRGGESDAMQNCPRGRTIVLLLQD